MINDNIEGIEFQNVNANEIKDEHNQSMSEVSYDSKSQIKMNKSSVIENTMNNTNYSHDISLKSGNKKKKIVLKQKENWRGVTLVPILLVTIAMTYLIRPILFAFKIYFLTTMIYADNSLPIINNDSSISLTFIIIGYLIIFLLPLGHLYNDYCYIITIEEHFIMKIYAFIILLIELIVQLPCTFLLSNKHTSVFLFSQKNLDVYATHYIIFFPTDFMMNTFEVVRQCIDSIYFMFLSTNKYNDIKDNIYFGFQKNMNILLLCFCTFQLLQNVLLNYGMKLVYGTSEQHEGYKPKEEEEEKGCCSSLCNKEN